jgi:hypothetical protein
VKEIETLLQIRARLWRIAMLTTYDPAVLTECEEIERLASQPVRFAEGA